MKDSEFRHLYEDWVRSEISDNESAGKDVPVDAEQTAIE